MPLISATLRHYLLLDIGDGESREGESQTRRKLTGEGLYWNDDAGGERERAARPEVVPQAGQTRQGGTLVKLRFS